MPFSYTSLHPSIFPANLNPKHCIVFHLGLTSKSETIEEMSQRSKSIQFLLFVAILMILASNVFGIGEKSLLSINEELPFPDSPSRGTKEANAAAIRSHAAQFSAADEDPYASDSFDSPEPSSPRYSIMQKVPVLGLARGQQSKLVPYQLSAPLEFHPHPFETFRSSSRRDHLWTLRRVQPGAPPSSTSELLGLLNSHASIRSTYDVKAVPDVLAIGTKYHAVQLRGHGLDVQTLRKLQEAGRPFYAQGANKKVWYFDTKDGTEYTFTDKIKGSDKRIIRNILAPTQQVAIQDPERARERRNDAERTAMVASHYTERERAGVSWFQRASEVARIFLKGRMHGD